MKEYAMNFEIDLMATSRDEGGITASLARQLIELGGKATPVGEPRVIRADVGTEGDFFFECKQTYQIELDDAELGDTEDESEND